MKTRFSTPDNREDLEIECAGSVLRQRETFGLEPDDAEWSLLRSLLRVALESDKSDFRELPLESLLERTRLPPAEREIILLQSQQPSSESPKRARARCRQLRELAETERRQRKLEQAVADGDHDRARAILSSTARPDTPKASRIGAWSPFPLETLPPVLSRFVEEHARSKGVDASMIALPLLGAVAGAIGNSLAVRAREDWREPVALWIATIARSGSKKSPSTKAALRQLRDIQSRYFKLAKDANAGRQEAEEPVKARRVFIDDCTPEKLLALLEENPRGLIYATDELAQLLGSLGRYRSGRGASAGETAQLCRIYDADSIDYDRKTDGHRHIPRALASIVGTIPPATWRQLATLDLQTSGLVPRFCCAMPPTKPGEWTEDDLDWRVEQAVHALLERLLAMPCEPNAETGVPEARELRLDADALGRFRRVYNRLQEQTHAREGLAASASGKAAGLVLRVAAILHACGDEPDADEIDGETMRRAVDLADWLHAERLRVFAMLETDSETAGRAELVSSIDWSRYPKGVTGRELWKDRKTSFADADDAERRLRECVADGLLEEHFGTRGDPAKGGRETLYFTRRENLQTETPSIDDE